VPAPLADVAGGLAAGGLRGTHSAVLLRSANAGANTIADHVTVLHQAIGQLPPEIAAGDRGFSSVLRPITGTSPDLIAEIPHHLKGWVDHCKVHQLGWGSIDAGGA
jgi:hypothetical protein